jgi:hypothetical protein
MKNPFSESSKLQRQLTKETKTEVPDIDVLEVIQTDNEFAEFLINIKDPKYGDMDLERVNSILERPQKRDLEILKEKYLLFQQQKEMRGDVQNLYEDEIVKELGIEVPEGAMGEAKEKIAEGLKELAQTNSLEFQKLKNKIAEYNKIKEELVALEEKLAEKVNMEAGKESIGAVKDRQGRLETATMTFRTLKGIKARVGHAFFGSRDTVHAIADFKHTYELAEQDLGKEMGETKDDLKKAEKLRDKLNDLRDFLLKDLQIGQALIETTQLEAKRIINAQMEDIRHNPDRLDTIPKADRGVLRADLESRATGFRTGLSTEDQAQLDRLVELDEYDDLESAPAGSLDTTKEARLVALSKEKSSRAKSRLLKIEAVRNLMVKMTEGKGKKGGLNYTSSVKMPDGSTESINVKDLLSGSETDIDRSLIKEMEKLIEAEIKGVIENVAIHSGRLDIFKSEVGPFFEKWKIGGLDSREKVRKFMADTMRNVCNSGNVNPVLKVQLKAFLAQRGLNPQKFVI